MVARLMSMLVKQQEKNLSRRAFSQQKQRCVQAWPALSILWADLAVELCKLDKELCCNDARVISWSLTISLLH